MSEPRAGQRLSPTTKKRLAARNRGEMTAERRRRIAEGVKRTVARQRAKEKTP